MAENGKNGYFWVTQIGKMVPGITPPNLMTKLGEIFTK